MSSQVTKWLALPLVEEKKISGKNTMPFHESCMLELFSYLSINIKHLCIYVYILLLHLEGKRPV